MCLFCFSNLDTSELCGMYMFSVTLPFTCDQALFKGGGGPGCRLPLVILRGSCINLTTIYISLDKTGEYSNK